MNEPLQANASLHRRSRSKENRKKNIVVVVALVAVLSGMGTLVYYAEPLYRLFCRVTGYGGTTNTATTAPNSISDQSVSVHFDTNVAPDLPWRFTPPKPLELRLGESKRVSFVGVNLGDEPILGTATFNVTPYKVGKYFNKIECFCFTEQLLMPGERKEFPVMFFVDPAITEDSNAKDISAIALSYTFFNKGTAARDEYIKKLQKPSKPVREIGS
ncbi:MAG: cytochrome c oxidase assembly protein [Rhodospirillaceae bacterium]